MNKTDYFDNASEMSLLYALIYGKDRVIWLNRTTGEHFYHPNNKRVFESVKREITKTGDFSPSCLPDDLLDHYSCITDASSTALPEYYHKKLEISKQIREAARIIETEMSLPSETTVSDIKAKLMKIGTNESNKPLSTQTLGDRALDRWEKRATDSRKVIHLGIPIVDDYVKLRSGEMCMVIAPPKTGKTWFLLKSALHTSIGLNVLFVSAEMHPDSLYVRACSNVAGVDFMPLEYSERLRQDLLGKWMDHAAPKINERKLSIVKARGATFSEFVAMAYEAKHAGVDIIYLDYLQRLRNPAKDERTAIMDMTRNISNLAGELEMLFVVASQASRAARSDTRTKAHHGKESGSIEEDSDVILALTDETKTEDGGFQELRDLTVDITQRNGMGGLAKIKMNIRTGEMFE